MSLGGRPGAPLGETLGEPEGDSLGAPLGAETGEAEGVSQGNLYVVMGYWVMDKKFTIVLGLMDMDMKAKGTYLPMVLNTNWS